MNRKEIRREDLTEEEFERVVDYFRILIKWDKELKEKQNKENENPKDL